MEAIEKLRQKGIAASHGDIGRLCKKYFIEELSVFGSATLDDVGKSGELCFLVSFEDGAAITLFDIIEMESEFEKLLNKKVDIVEKAAISNPVRRERILAEREIVYERER
jgi:predicted nucleotidyltransferase